MGNEHQSLIEKTKNLIVNFDDRIKLNDVLTQEMLRVQNTIGTFDFTILHVMRAKQQLEIAIDLKADKQFHDSVNLLYWTEQHLKISNQLDAVVKQINIAANQLSFLNRLKSGDLHFKPEQPFIVENQLHNSISNLLQDAKLQIIEELQNDPHEWENFITKVECEVHTLANMMFIVGKWGQGQEKNSICDHINKVFGAVFEESCEIKKFLKDFKIYPLILISTNYGTGLLNSHPTRLSDLYDFLTTPIDLIDNSKGNRIADNLIFHIWEGRQNLNWRVFEDPSVRKSKFTSETMLQKISFLDHLPQILNKWLQNEFTEVTDYKTLICKYKILSSLIFMERFENSWLGNNLRFKNPSDYNFFKFNFNQNFFNDELEILDSLLSDENLSNLREAGFKRTDPESIQLFKLFYIELNYFPEGWNYDMLKYMNA